MTLVRLHGLIEDTRRSMNLGPGAAVIADPSLVHNWSSFMVMENRSEYTNNTMP